MNTILRNILLTVNTLAFVASIMWAIDKPNYDSIISSLVLIATLIGLWISPSNDKSALKQKQKNGNNSKNFQAGNDINIFKNNE